jgi:hypothetical protein
MRIQNLEEKLQKQEEKIEKQDKVIEELLQLPIIGNALSKYTNQKAQEILEIASRDDRVNRDDGRSGSIASIICCGFVR